MEHLRSKEKEPRPHPIGNFLRRQKTTEKEEVKTMNILEKLSEYSLIACINMPVDTEEARPLAEALRRGGICAAEVSLAIDNAAEIIETLHSCGLFTGANIHEVGQIEKIIPEHVAWLSLGERLPRPDAEIPCIMRGSAGNPLCIEVTKENMQGVFAANEKEYQSIFFLDLFFEAISRRDWSAVTGICKRAAKTMLGTYLHHIGINSSDFASCNKTVEALSVQLGLSQSKETPTAIFVDDFFEIMKFPGPGENGHICVRVACIHRAINYLKRIGVKFDENSRQYNAAGDLFVIYFEEPIAGFAFHLIEA